MGLNWNMTDFTEDYFELQLTFNQPDFVASTPEEDYLIVNIVAAEWFIDKTDFLPLESTTL